MLLAIMFIVVHVDRSQAPLIPFSTNGDVDVERFRAYCVWGRRLACLIH